MKKKNSKIAKKVSKKTGAKKTGEKKSLLKKNSHVLKFHIENVRCFASRQTLEIRPLTFLIGENSTGKTTLLACFNVLNNIIRPHAPWDTGDFNEKPYNMGSFQNIIRKANKKNRTKKEKTFSIGFSTENTKTKSKKPKINCNVQFKKKKDGAEEPTIDYIDMQYGDYTLLFNYTKKQFSFKDKSKSSAFKEPLPEQLKRHPMPLPVLFSIIQQLGSINKKNQKKPQQKNIKKITEQIIKETRSLFPRILDLAPIRSKPKRTYDPIKEGIDPEGKEIPITLMQVESKKEWNILYNNLFWPNLWVIFRCKSQKV